MVAVRGHDDPTPEDGAVKPSYADDEGKRRMDEMRSQIQQLLSEQEKFRDERTAAWNSLFTTTVSIVFLMALLSAVAIGFSLRREARWLAKKFNSSLERSRQETEQFRSLFEGIKEYGIALLDPRGTILRWSPGAERLTGYLAGEAVGKNIAAIEPTDDIARQQSEGFLSRADELGKYETETWRARKDGSKFWSDLVVTALREADGALRGFSAVFRDYSKRKQIEQERAFLIQKLEEGVRGRDDFLAMASHELKTPMTSISLQLQSIRKMARRQGENSDVYSVKARVLDTFERQTERMNKLVEMMLDMTRIHSGKLPLTFQSINLSELVEGAIRDYEDEFQASGCPLSVSVEPGITLEGDAFRIEQAIVNLLTNAHRYACVGAIHVELKKTDTAALLSVRDVGPGVPREHQRRIFERYGRIEGIHDQGGLGLGLYITKEFVEAHNGQVRVESEPGKGSTFTIELPLS